MAEKIIAGKTIEVNEEGYFKDASQWTSEMADEMAKEFNLELTEVRFKVLDFLRQRQKAGEALTIRSVGKSGITDIKGFYQLFPGAPLKISSKLSGIPKPTSCI